MEFLKTLFHSHTIINDMGYTYCNECGSPFSSLSEARNIMQSKRNTNKANELLHLEPIRWNNMRTGVSRDGKTIMRCKECIIIECEGKIRCLMCGHIPLDKTITTAPNINSKEIKPYFNRWYSARIEIDSLLNR